MHVILPMLQNPGQVIAHQFDCASILFAMIVGFDEHAHRLTPEELLAFLNRHFTQMDHICALQGVTKIETVGEEYVCAVGVVPQDEREDLQRGHGSSLGRLVRAAVGIIQLQAEELQLQLGVHTGPVVAGVIGQKLPRFRLFGDTVNTAARLMQKGVPGQLQLGEETRRALPDWARVQRRGEIELKGKGQVTTYLLDVRGTCRRASLSPPEAVLDVGPPQAPSRTSIVQQVVSSLERARHARLRGQMARHGTGSVMQGQLSDRSMGKASDTIEEEGSEESDPEIREVEAEVTAMLEAVPSRLKEDEEKRRKFEEVLKELSSKEGGRSCSWACWCTAGLKSQETSPEVEEQWLRWFHETCICKKLDARLDRQAQALLVLTAFELFCCVFFSQCFKHPHYHGRDSRGHLRLPVFLGCRAASFTVITFWQRLVRARARLLRQPLEAQLLLLLSCCAVAVLMFFSYDAMALIDDKVNISEAMTKEQLLAHLLPFQRGSAVASLAFFPMYLIITSQHPFLFLHSCAFVLLAALLMMVPQLEAFHEGLDFNLFFSSNAKVLLVLASLLNASLQWTAERNSRHRFLAGRAVESTHERIGTILRTLLPPLVVEEIRELALNATPPTHKYRGAAIAQSDLVGFTKLASTQRPQEVVHFIGELFGLFDDLTDKHEVYKVETVGDAYIAGMAELPLTQKCWPVSVVLFGLEMVRATQEWARSRGWSVNCRVGVAYGECIGGIVGTEMQRYHLFGELMTCLEVLESTAPEGRVQVSVACKEAAEAQMCRDGIPGELVSFERRTGEHLTTSKGDVHEFAEVGGPTFVVKSSASFRGWIGS